MASCTVCCGPSGKAERVETKMSAQENKTLVRREQQELWNHTDELHAAQELFAADQAEAAKSTSQHISAEASRMC